MNVLRLKETLLMNKVEFLEKTVFFLVKPKIYWVMCYVLQMQINKFVFDYKWNSILRA